MKIKLRGLGRSLKIIVSNSKADTTTDSVWLQGGIMRIMCGNIPTLMQKD